MMGEPSSMSGELAALRASRDLLREVSTTSDLPRTADAILEAACRIEGIDCGGIYLVEHGTGSLRLTAHRGLPPQFIAQTSLYGADAPEAALVRAGQALYLDDAELARLEHVPSARLCRAAGLQAVAVLPVQFDDRVVAALNLGSHTHREIPLPIRDALEVMIAPLGGALARVQADDALRSRTDQFEAVRTISMEITRELDFPRLLDLITRRAVDLVSAGSGGVHLWDEGVQALVPQAWAGTLAPWQEQVRYLLGDGVVGTVAERREGMIINDYRQWAGALPIFLQRTDIASVLAEPLLYQGRLLGVIAITRAAGRPFVEEDQRLLRLFAAQAAIAIENARLYEAMVRRSTEREALLQASRAIDSSLDPGQVLQAIVQQAAAISAAPIVRLFLLDEDGQSLRCRVGVGFPLDAEPELVIPVGTSLSGEVAATGEFVAVSDTREDSRTRFPEHIATYGVVSYLGLPVKFQTRLFGVLVFNTRAPRHYTADEITFLAAFAQQAAVAIQNARLYEAAQRDVAERTKAEQTLRAHQDRLAALLRGSLELAQIQPLERLVGGLGEACARLLSADGGDVRILEGADLVKIVAWGDHEAVGSPARLRMGEGLSGVMAASAEPLIVDPLAEDARLPAPVRDSFRRLGHQAWFGVPVKLGDRLLGTLNMWSRKHFSPEDIAIATAFAAQAAIALENARLYAELRDSFEQLQHAQAAVVQGEKLRALGQMAAGIAHDLNNMLAAILGQAEMIRLHAQDSAVQSALEVLYTAASDGAQVVRRLQGFGRQKAEGPLVPCDLATLAQEALALTRPRWKDDAQRENRLIQVWTALENLPQILGDPAEIREALTNLILNAVDAMPTGGNLTVSGYTEGTPGDSSGASGVVLTLTDTGTGMPEEIRRQIFDPFFTTKGHKGTGLGLAMVYGILQRHGGTIAVTSSPGQGTTFTLRFPVATRDEPLAAAPESVVVPGPVCLLVIDDEPLVRQSIANLLRACGHTVIEAESGSEGVGLLAETQVDLVFTDLGMPGMTGWEVAQQVKAAHPRLPVVLLTGWGHHFPEHPDAQTCVDQVLAKPIRLDELQKVVARLTMRPEAL